MASDDATKGDKGAKGKTEEHGGVLALTSPRNPR